MYFYLTCKRTKMTSVLFHPLIIKVVGSWKFLRYPKPNRKILGSSVRSRTDNPSNIPSNTCRQTPT